MERGLDIDRAAVFRGGMKLPLRYCLAGEMVETVVDATKDAHAADRTVGADDSVEDHRTSDIFAHELYRVGGINFAGRGRLG